MSTTTGAVTRRIRLRALANALNGSTAAGLALAALGGARVRRGPRRLWLADGYRWGFPRAGAFTVGDVLLTAGRWDELARTRPGLLEHEERHAGQYALCGGLPLVPLYLAAAAWSWLRTGTHYSRNVFESRAGLRAGGYSPAGPRPLLRRRTGRPGGGGVRGAGVAVPGAGSA